jgi:antirestriction protein ArdC
MTVYEIVLEQIMEKMRQGVVPWRSHLKSPGMPASLVTKKPYRGVNHLMLCMNEYASPYYVTFKQAQELGGKILPGEKGYLLVFYKSLADDGSADPDKPHSMILRYYKVWNVAQTTLEVKEEGSEIMQSLAACERIVSAMPQPPRIKHLPQTPYYLTSEDTVVIPALTSFDQPDFYYSCLFHELGHATGHHSRLNRPTLTNSDGYGGNMYSQEELIAELTACFLCNEAGVLPQTMENSATYLNSWMQVFNNNKKMLFIASTAAQKAVDYITGRGTSPVPFLDIEEV